MKNQENTTKKAKKPLKETCILSSKRHITQSNILKKILDWLKKIKLEKDSP